MAELTREQRMQMRGEVERRRGDPGYTGIFYIGDADLLSLLDAADERDRLRAEIAEMQESMDVLQAPDEVAIRELGG